MKKIIASLLLMSSAISMNAAVNVNRIEPTHWMAATWSMNP